jgi:antirestriction protein ArdC
MGKRDVYQDVTDTIVAALETAGEWKRPWQSLSADASSPRSIDGRAYRGTNVLLLWAAAMDCGYSHGVWGTYKAWNAKGAQVRKGERGTMVTLWKPGSRKATESETANGKGDKVETLFLTHFTVFNAAQVDGWEMPDQPAGPDPIDHAATFFANIGADVTYSGNSAYYSRTPVDRIVLPPLAAFATAEHFYSTSAHEHTHWTGDTTRLARDFSGRFGSEAYAFEELVAELGAAFIGAHLGIGSVTREDHASYLKSWLKVLRNDKKAIFTAASKAQQAADYLIAAAGEEEEDERTEQAAA